MCMELLDNNVNIKYYKKSSANVILTHINSQKSQLFRPIVPIDIIEKALERYKSDEDIFDLINRIDIDQYYNEIIALFIIKGRYELTHRIFDENDKPYNPFLTQIAIKYNNLDMVFLLQKRYPIAYTENEKLYVEPLLTSLKDNHYWWLAKIYILKGLMDNISYTQIEELLAIFINWIEEEDPENNVLYYCQNSLLLCWNLVEICRIIKSEYEFLSGFAEKVEDVAVKVTSAYIESIQNEAKLRELVFEKDFENRDSLEIVSTYNIIGIINNKNMEKMALELWTSKYDLK